MNGNSAEKPQALLNDIDRFDKESEKHERIHRRAQTGILRGFSPSSWMLMLKCAGL